MISIAFRQATCGAHWLGTTGNSRDLVLYPFGHHVSYFTLSGIWWGRIGISLDCTLLHYL